MAATIADQTDYSQPFIVRVLATPVIGGTGGAPLPTVGQIFPTGRA